MPSISASLLILPWLSLVASALDSTHSKPLPDPCRKPLVRLYRGNFRSPNGYWTPGRIAEAIRTLKQAQLPLHHWKQDPEFEAKVSNILLNRFDYPRKLQSLYRAAERFKPGLWNELTGPSQSDWNLLSMEETLRTLNRSGVDLSEPTFHERHSPEIQLIIHQFSGKEVDEQQFYASVRDYYPGGWEGALKALRINQEPPKSRRRSDSASTFKERLKNPLVAEWVIKVLYDRGIPLHANAINHDNSALTRYLIRKTTGFSVGGSTLYTTFQRNFPGGWTQALKRLDIDPARTRSRAWAGEKFWTPEKILKAIQVLHERGVPVNSGAIQFDTSLETSAILKEVFGVGTTGAALFSASRRLSSPYWDDSLRKAGLDPWQIRRNIWAVMRLSEVTTSGHTGARADTGRHYQRVVGKAPQQPEDEMTSLEIVSRVEEARSELALADQPLFDAMIDLIYGNPEKLSPPEIAALLSESQGTAVSEEKVNALMAPLRKNLATHF